jgi:hypothetical protein
MRPRVSLRLHESLCRDLMLPQFSLSRVGTEPTTWLKKEIVGNGPTDWKCFYFLWHTRPKPYISPKIFLDSISPKACPYFSPKAFPRLSLVQTGWGLCVRAWPDRIYPMRSDRKQGLTQKWKLLSVRADALRVGRRDSLSQSLILSVSDQSTEDVVWTLISFFVVNLKKLSLTVEYISHEIWWEIGTRDSLDCVQKNYFLCCTIDMSYSGWNVHKTWIDY